MKKVAQTLSAKAAFVLFVLLSAAMPLSGCAVVAGPLLGAGGLAFAPLQYASTAYTLGEFTYQYAANDRTPDQVLEAKYDAVVSGEAFALPEYLKSEPAGPEAPVMTARAEYPEGPALSDEARRKRIERLLGERRSRFQRLELRRMAFLRAGGPRRNLTLGQTAMASSGPDLVRGTGSEVSLD